MTKNKPLVFIIDDEEHCLGSYELYCEKAGFEPMCFSGGKEFLDYYKVFLTEPRTHIIISDIGMPSITGIDLFKEIKSLSGEGIFIFLTGKEDIGIAVNCMKLGAFDFVNKPVSFDLLKTIMDKAFGYSDLQARNEELESIISDSTDFFGLIGVSSKMKDIFSLLRRVAKVDASVLITGESGTGKEKVARAIHSASPRRLKPFVPVNCSSIPENLIESELFGHAKGSFTGADSKKIGLFQEANGGTIFLDEIGDMPYQLQSKILRVLQEKEIRPVGSNKIIPVDVRVLSATHKNLKESIAAKEFREDLYYRLSVFPVELPALRERKDDIELLANYFLKKYGELWQRPTVKMSKQAEKIILNHSWPGNIRELENTIERAMILCDSRQLEVDHLFIDSNCPKSLTDWIDKLEKVPTLKEFELEFIKSALKRTNNHKDKAAKILGIGRKTLYRKEQELKSELSRT